MIADHSCHPAADELQSFGQGLLAPSAAAVVEQHVAACESCCRQLEEAPADSFVGRLREAGKVSQATTADAAAGTLADAADVPAELHDHPRYRVLGLVGQGGMGAVYRAEHRRMERPVALKVINPGLIQNPTTVQRFHQEVRTAARLVHPNIVTAHDADEAGGLHFLVMEYVEGRSLADLVAERGPLPVAKACDYARQAALGLQHAHEQGMVHRDIKPHNLMVTSGVVKILDFGLARLARAPETLADGAQTADSSLTGAGTVMGTADYIAPEQAADPRAADIRADIYSLGCTLFYLLTGRPPFPDGGVQDKIAQHANTPLPPLAALRAGLSPDLAAVVARMTAKDPASRYQTPAAVADALAPFAKESPRRSVPRRRALLAVAASIVAVGLMLAGAVVVRVTTDQGDVTVKTDDPNIELIVRKGGRIVRITDTKTGQSWDLDTRNLTLADADKPNGLTIAVDGRTTITLHRNGRELETVVAIDFSGEKPRPAPFPTAEELAKRPNASDALKPEDVSDAARLLVSAKPGESFDDPALVAVLGDTRFRFPTETGAVAGLKYSPDGRYLVASSRPSYVKTDKNGRPVSPEMPRDLLVHVFDAATGQRLSLMKCIDFAPGKDRLVALALERTVEIRTATGEFKRKFFIPNDIEEVAAIAWSPDGKLIAVGDAKGQRVSLMNAGSGQYLFFKAMPFQEKATQIVVGTARLRFSSDSEVLVMNWTDGLAAAQNLPPKKELKQIKLPLDDFEDVVFGRDGKPLAILPRNKGGNRVVLTYNPKGNRLSDVRCTTMTPRLDVADGVLVVSTMQPHETALTVGRYDAETGKLLGEVADIGVTNRHQPWAVSPDGKQVAILPPQSDKGGGVIAVYDLTTGKPTRPPGGHVMEVSEVAFSPDGKKLASIGDDGTLLFWDLATGKVIRKADVPPGVRRVAFSPDAGVYAVASQGKPDADQTVENIELRNTANDAVLYPNDTATLPQHVTSLVFSLDGRFLVAASDAGTVRVIRTKDGTTEHLEKIADPGPIAFTPDGSYLLACDSRSVCYVIQVHDEKPARGNNAGVVTEWDGAGVWWFKQGLRSCLSFLPDGRTMAVPRALGNPGVLLVDWHDGKVTREINDQPRENGKFQVNALGPAGRFAAVSWVDDQGHELGCLIRDLSAQPPRDRFFAVKSSGSTKAYVFSPEGRYLAVAGPGGLISLMRLEARGMAK
jgi:serine/threonine protein kinase/WD40 repeat protein